MKIDFINDEKFIIYVNKYYYSFDKNTLNDFLMKLFKHLKKIFNIDTYGNYDITCYIDINYGIIMDISKTIDAFTKYSKKINLNIKYVEETFLFELEDYFLTKYKKYKYNDKYYIDSKNYSNTSELYTKIVYGNDKYKIINSN